MPGPDQAALCCTEAVKASDFFGYVGMQAPRTYGVVFTASL